MIYVTRFSNMSSLNKLLVHNFIRVSLFIDPRRRLWYQDRLSTVFGDSNRWRRSNKYSGLLTWSIYSTTPIQGVERREYPQERENCHNKKTGQLKINVFFVSGITLQHDSSRNSSRDDDLVFLDRPLEKIDERHESESENEEVRHDVTIEGPQTGTNLIKPFFKMCI